ncbi:MAG TPA: MBOAT family O-acyltransferase, partial [Bacillota bacterium]|nr:MBOAT family O-acyltransferase [Bacillota bacterium]
NQIGGLWRQCVGIGFESITVPMAWMSIFAYSFQLYFDFCGYSLMAIGLGRMLGFEFPENFRDPYMAVSMTDFWRRWHMSLGSWFREYVYFPLGGSKRGFSRTILNLLTVWMLTGIWHGAGYNFILWGFVLFVLIALERLGLKDFFETHRFIGHLYMLFAIPLTWALFVNTDFSNLKLFFQRLVGLGDTVAVFTEDYIKYGKQYGILLLACLFFSTDLPRRLKKRIHGSPAYYLAMLVIFCGVAYCLYKGMDDPFLYFQF